MKEGIKAGGITGVVLFLAMVSPVEPFSGDPPLERIALPEGFAIEVFASGIPDARSLASGPQGVVFVGNRQEDKVWAIADTNGDGKGDRKVVIAENLTAPNGVAFSGNDLYVAERSRILRYDAIEDRIDQPPEPVMISNDFPAESHHGWKYIAFGPDGYLYVPVGAPCNVCLESDDRFASMTRMMPDGSDFSVFARGIRNTVGFAWHPETGELWFTDNGRDNMGDDIPSDELNRAPAPGMHFGFPFCHEGTIADPEFGAGRSCDEFVPPVVKLGAHVAALGMKFYTGTMFPPEYRNRIFIAQHGSWNRSEKAGYRVVSVDVSGESPVTTVFAEGWMENETVWGRPVDVLVMPDGALLVSDDLAGAVYRIVFTPATEVGSVLKDRAGKSNREYRRIRQQQPVAGFTLEGKRIPRKKKVAPVLLVDPVSRGKNLRSVINGSPE